jgi:hypothetical protein
MHPKVAHQLSGQSFVGVQECAPGDQSRHLSEATGAVFCSAKERPLKRDEFTPFS